MEGKSDSPPVTRQPHDAVAVTESSANLERPDDVDYGYGEMKTRKFWATVFSRQNWGSFIFACFFIIATGIIYFVATVADYPFFEYQPVLMNNAPVYGMDSIFMRPERGNTIPAAVAIVVPIVLFVGNVVFFEFLLMIMERNNALVACITILHFFLDMMATFFLQQFFQQLATYLVGEPRPEAYYRCGLDKATSAEDFQQLVTLCQRNDPDAFKSFFSGHSSGSMALGLYYSFYVSYTIYYRSANPIIISRHDRSLEDVYACCSLKRFYNDFKHALVLLAMVCGVAWGLLVGISRISDQKHAPWDVLAGWFVGMIIPIITFPRAARMQPYMIMDLRPRAWHDKRKRELQKYEL